jgi:bifunctional UDP-N-acetylglucosamine pyrophosphorylase/glucosamine-1-phosphate N-acetyltransferase
MLVLFKLGDIFVQFPQDHHPAQSTNPQSTGANMKTIPVILAAGQGTRMISQTPKMVHALLGRPLVWHAVQAAKSATEENPVIVIGHGAEVVKNALGQQYQYVFQGELLGTGHALQQTKSVLEDHSDYIIVTYGDMPLIKPGTLKALISAQETHNGPMTMLTILADNPRGFGRILRDSDGYVRAIVEEVDATPDQLAIQELNPGVYCFKADWLWDTLEQIKLSPKGEYFLTDLVEIAVKQGKSVKTIRVEDATEMIGVNNRVHLAESAAILRNRINQSLMLAGVTIIDPQSTYIDPGIPIGQDTVIWPNTHLQGNTEVGSSCSLGPNSIIRDTKIGDYCEITASVLEGATLEDEVDVGPFAHLRKGAHLAQGVHMGNFGEVKNSYLGPGTKMGHFSYIGDTTTGKDVNIGAGTVTCNYDGVQKHPTRIGSEVFIGSDSMLVAPVSLGDGARTGAGSVVTKDVPENTLVVGIPARAISKLKNKEKKE